MIRLEAYKLENLTALFNLQLPPEQEEFTALPKDLIADVQDDPQRLGVTILKDDQPVGFFVLSVGEHRDKYLTTPDPDGVALGALSIDVSQQGQGVATQAMQALLAFVPFSFSQRQARLAGGQSA